MFSSFPSSWERRSWDPDPALSEAESTCFPLRPSDLQQPPGVKPFPSQPCFPHFWKGVRTSPASFLGGVAKSDEIKDEVTRGQSGRAPQFKPLMKGETEGPERRTGWPQLTQPLEVGLGLQLGFLHQLPHTRNPGGAVDQAELPFCCDLSHWAGAPVRQARVCPSWSEWLWPTDRPRPG